MRKWLILIGAALFVACAKQGYPTGGPKDETPPKVVKSDPPNATHQFTGDRFYVEFDEYVVLKDATNNVLISPPLKSKPDFSTKGKGVVVRIKDTLQPNATYLFQFKEAIADFTEGNVLPSYEYVFSTGATMDTMMIGGKVEDALRGGAWKESVSVLAYREIDAVSDDTIAIHQQPAYVTRCDKEGSFAFHYIPAGDYRIVAVEDQNRNLRVDNGEAVGWCEAMVAATDSVDSTKWVRLSISAPRQEVQRITKAEMTDRGRIAIVATLPLQEPRIEGVEGEWRLNSRRDTMWVWCQEALTDSVQVVIADGDFSDTLRLRYQAPKRGKGRTPSNQASGQPLVKVAWGARGPFYDSIPLKFEVPIVQHADSLKVRVMNVEDSAVDYCGLRVGNEGMMAWVDTVLISGKKYRFLVPSGIVADYYGRPNDSLSVEATMLDYGVLSVEVNGPDGEAIVVEVLDKNDTVVRRTQIVGKQKLRFAHLDGGDYRLRAIFDVDRDGRWTPADYRKGSPAERVVYYQKTLQLREKWEMDERWFLEGYKRVKEQPKLGLSGGLIKR